MTALAAALAGPDRPAYVAGSVVAAPGPYVIVGAPSLELETGVCRGPVTYTQPVAVVAAGPDPAHLLELWDAVEDVLAAVPAGWTVTTPVAPTQYDTPQSPAVEFTLTKDTEL